jgi:hypothetical protein
MLLYYNRDDWQVDRFVVGVEVQSRGFRIRIYHRIGVPRVGGLCNGELMVIFDVKS